MTSTPGGGTRRRPTNAGRAVTVWTRRLHFYVGLYFLFFIWLFSVTGLFLNHPEWAFTRYWPLRQERVSERSFSVLPDTGDMVVAQALREQLALAGEITQVERRLADSLVIVQLSRPGRIHRIEASLARGTARVFETNVNAIGVMDALHKFTGVRLDDAGQRRDWVLTTVWAFAMDAVAIGLLVMVASGLYLWYRLGKKRLAGALALAGGTAVCVFFVFGLSRLA